MNKEELMQFKKDLLHLIRTDKEIKDVIYNIVVGHERFAKCIEDTNESNEYDRSWAEARAWT